MTGAVDLLPAEAEVLERALAHAMTDLLPVPIEDVLDPARTPALFLPFLGHHRSVDLWFDDWPEARKRQMIGEAVTLARKKGTRAGAIRFLEYVDATLVDAVSYPSPFIMGHAFVGRTPIGHPAFVANYLVKVDTFVPQQAFIMGRSFIGQDFIQAPSTEKLDRCLVALRAAAVAAPDSPLEIRVDFQHHRLLTVADAPRLGEGHRLGEYIARTRL